MDTKWKNRKKIISFLIFFLGVNITLGSLADIVKNKPSGVRIWQISTLLEDDYQQTGRFRSYIADRLESFLIMAVGGSGLGGIWGYDNGRYYGGGYNGDYYYGDYYSDIFDDYFEGYGGTFYSFDLGDPFDLEDSSDQPTVSRKELWEVNDYLFGLEEILDSYTDIYQDMLDSLNESEDRDSYPSELETYQSILADYQSSLQDYLDDIGDYLDRASREDTENISPLTEEQKKKLADKFHEAVKEDKNLLYTIAYEGQVLYSNTDLLPTDGQLTAPEGYNFLLYFDGEKVRILKDGKEVNVYGDGYYRESSEWYVPGYSNFQLDDNAKKATVCIAAAKDPVLYMKGTYGNGGSTQYDNALYWFDYNLQIRHRQLTMDFIGLAAGILLLLSAFLTGKSRREATEGIAHFQAKMWLEAKIILLLAMFYLFYMACIFFITNDCGYDLVQELYYAYDMAFNTNVLFILGRELLNALPSHLWLLLFWSLWLLWNDLRHNKKIWKNSLTAKLYRTFSAKGLNHTLSRKMGRRNRGLFVVSLLYGLLMSGSVLFLSVTKSWAQSFTLLHLLTILGTICFLALQFTAGAKNLENARDVEALSCRISQIRNGKYTSASEGNQSPMAQSGNITGSSGQQSGDSADGSGQAGTGQDGKNLFAGHDLDTVMAQLEDIRHGMANAVDEQIKSQRMKVELIANVSHDIKTPLTSIISYVEILKQEKDLPEQVKDYILILDEKSQRLKNMVQDVFAVSKAASGELPIQMEALDFGKLLRQTMADMEEQINGSPVTFRTEIPDSPVMIMADGQRLYRVFQNLIQNAIQHSLHGSRVYVTLQTDNTLAVASVKNTSQLELERGKDFAERFARGDESRTDGGSGLGLSIAQSFTEACGGEFIWETDADLFVVKVSFPIL